MPLDLKKILLITAIPVFPALCLCFCCTQKPEYKASVKLPYVLPYNLENPSLTINLASEALTEISGFGPTDTNGVFLAIADERGEVFFVDGIGGGAIRHQVLFREKGDFEGVEMAENKIWAVKSDGKLFEISNWKQTPPQVTEHNNALKKEDDVEGLCYDPGQHALLLACKGDPDSSYARKIYAFNLKTKTLGDQPIYTIDPIAVNAVVPYLETEKHDFFSPSGIAVHPQTNDVYVISSALKRLVVLYKNTGAIRYATRIDKKLMPQPEGIAFDQAGNLYLTSEGKKGQGLILRFDVVKN